MDKIAQLLIVLILVILGTAWRISYLMSVIRAELNYVTPRSLAYIKITNVRSA
jgi:hypothetical protein